MSRYLLKKATPADETRLKALYSEKSREGMVQINLDRGNDFFGSLDVQGFNNVVYYVEDTLTGLIAGAGIRSLRQCYVNGKVETIGYLSSLRVAQSHRKSRAMHLIFDQLRQMYLQGESAGYLCSVFKSNKNATGVLTSHKAGIPHFKTVGQYQTSVFVPKKLRGKTNAQITVRKAAPDDIPALVDFLNTQGAEQQFAPHYSVDDFSQQSRTLKGLSINDIYLATQHDCIIGCLAFWDQTTFRQWKVGGYSTTLAALRPWLNPMLGLTNMPLLPKANQTLNYRLLSLVCIQRNDPMVFRTLFNQAVTSLDKKNNTLVSAGFFTTDPLVECLPRLSITFKSTIFIGYWDETRHQIEALENRAPFIEAASL